MYIRRLFIGDWVFSNSHVICIIDDVSGQFFVNIVEV